MYVTQILWAWLLLEAFTPIALTQRHMQRRGHRKFELYDEAGENEDVRNGPAPPGSVNYMQRYARPFEGLHQNTPPAQEQHMRNQEEPSEDASVELTNSKEDEDEDMRNYGGPNARRFPNGDMLEEQPNYNRKYEKNSEVMRTYMPFTEEESLKSNEEPSEEDAVEDQASEEGENENVRQGARRYKEYIPNYNMLEKMSLHGSNSMNLRSDEVSEKNRDSEKDENKNEEGFLNPTMSEELLHYKGDYGEAYQADQQNTKTMGDIAASLESTKTSQADQQNTKTTEDETASLESSKISEADQQNTKTIGDGTALLESVKTPQADQQDTKKTENKTASLESTTPSIAGSSTAETIPPEADQQNTKTTQYETVSLENSTLSMFDSSTAETTPSQVIQYNTTIAEVKHIQNETASTTTTKPSGSTAQTTPIDSTQEKTKNIEVTSTQNGTDFLDDGRGLEDRSNGTVFLE